MKLLFCLIVLLSVSLVYSKDEYFFIRPDVRRCAAPRCGGNFLTKVNDQEGSKEYHQVEMSMVDATINTGLLNNFTNIIVYGELTAASIDNGQNEYYNLFLKGIYHEMQVPPQDPNPSLVRAKEKYFTLSSSNCENDFSSCSNIKSNLINTGDENNIKKYSHPYSGVPLLDQVWFNSRFFGTVDTPAILKGYITGNSIKVSKVYVLTSDPHSKCPENQSNCTGTEIPTYARKDGSRCPIFVGCTHRGPCPLIVPHCSEGYTQYRLASFGSRGCPKYYCDPSFLIDPIKADNP